MSPSALDLMVGASTAVSASSITSFPENRYVLASLMRQEDPHRPSLPRPILPGSVRCSKAGYHRPAPQEGGTLGWWQWHE
ncbi:hypothetical protein E2C01_090860 [Portunus trituberculatus]|uniref:Uncharacterized protein n=1 Tax=Portunus trituberculatus TaxID=210409 RepID=A0A5B7JCH9_PORTR|nr:hypothetical protein [Portunus trituberculatus]